MPALCSPFAHSTSTCRYTSPCGPRPSRFDVDLKDSKIDDFRRHRAKCHYISLTRAEKHLRPETEIAVLDVLISVACVRRAQIPLCALRILLLVVDVRLGQFGQVCHAGAAAINLDTKD